MQGTGTGTGTAPLPVALVLLPVQWAHRLQLAHFPLHLLRGRCTRTTALVRRSSSGTGGRQRRRCPAIHLLWCHSREAAQLHLPQQQAGRLMMARRPLCRRCRWTCCASRRPTTSTSTRRPATSRWATSPRGVLADGNQLTKARAFSLQLCCICCSALKPGPRSAQAAADLVLQSRAAAAAAWPRDLPRRSRM